MKFGMDIITEAFSVILVIDDWVKWVALFTL